MPLNGGTGQMQRKQFDTDTDSEVGPIVSTVAAEMANLLELMGNLYVVMIYDLLR